MGRDFRWLLASTWVNSLGDGIMLAAGPLLVASLTSDPLLISSGATVQWLPRLLFGLFAGAISDRLDRRGIIFIANSIRVVVLALLATSVALEHASILMVLGALLVLSTAEVFADNSASALLPMLVTRDELSRANARQQTAFITVNQLAGPPIGAFAFAAGAALPIASQALLLVAGAITLTRIRGRTAPPPAAERRHIRHEIAEGIRWTIAHPAMRTLVVTIFVFNITFGAAWSVLVLYASDRIGLGAVGFGLVTTTSAVGGLCGTASYAWITRHVSLGGIMRIGLVIETLTHLALASTTSAWVALPVFFVFGAHAFIWGTTSNAVRQRAVPEQLQGRVASVNVVGVFGGLVVGSFVGGSLARAFDVAAPFWFAFAGSAIFLVLIWRQLAHVAHDEPA